MLQYPSSENKPGDGVKLKLTMDAVNINADSELLFKGK